MSLPDQSLLFGRSKNRWIFMFGDGTRLSSNEFGKLSLKWSLDFGERLTEELFAPGQPGWMLCGGSLIRENVTPAHLYISMLYLAAIVAYVELILDAEETVIIEVKAGILENMVNMDVPQKGLANEELLKHLDHVLDNLFQAAIHDLKSHAHNIPKTSSSMPHEATELIYSLLKGAYWGEDSEALFLSHSTEQLHYAQKVQQTLDEVPLSILVTLQKQVLVSLAIET